MTRTAPRPPTEVAEKAQRRRFSAKYKLKILQRADACERDGDLGSLLRKEGLYSSHLAQWRAARAAGAIAGLKPRQRGRKPMPVDSRDNRIMALEREIAELTLRAQRAEGLVELQKKLTALFEPATVLAGGRA